MREYLLRGMGFETKVSNLNPALILVLSRDIANIRHTQVLGNNARLFRRVFDGAQTQLRQVFGMEMSELPVKEKRTLKDRQSRLCLNLFLPQIRIRLTIFQRGVR